jgi:hypothetical protein
VIRSCRQGKRLAEADEQGDERCSECDRPFSFHMENNPLILRGDPGDPVLPAEAVFAALARAEDLVSRLDERIRGCGFADGWRSRADIRAVIGAMAADGELVHPEDLILHDLGADTRPPDTAVAKARSLLQARRKAHGGGPELLSWSGLAWLSGLTRHAPPPGGRPTAQIAGRPDTLSGYAALAGFFEALAKGQSESDRAGVEDCLAVLDVAGVPPLLQAAAWMEAWRLVDPLPRHRPVGALATAVLLRTARRFASGLFPVEVAMGRRPVPGRLAWAPIDERLVFWLGLLETAASLELEELIRLGHQKALVERKARGGRRGNRAPDLATLAVAAPVMTTDSIARALSITPQASLQLVRRMEGVLHEITGRSRYRVWRL